MRGHAHHRWIMGLVLLLGFLAVGVAPAHFLAKVLFHFTGRPPELAVQIVVSAAAYLLFLGIFLRLVRTHHRHHHGGRERRFDPFAELADAIDRIAAGDFDVLVDSAGGRIELAEKINRMARQLSSMEHMRQDFVSNVSHEIGSPLTSIRGFAELLKKENLSPEDRIRYAEVIESESRRLSRLGDNLLKLSLLDAAHDGQGTLVRGQFRLDKQLGDILLALEPQWSAKEIELDVSLPQATVSADVELLRQVWTNLLHNAIKFTPEGGRISVTLSPGEAETTVAVSDTGAGIAESDLIHIFERFYKADRARGSGGSGLGLALAKRIVDLHEGTISASSESGNGSTFTVRLPNNH